MSSKTQGSSYAYSLMNGLWWLGGLDFGEEHEDEEDKEEEAEEEAEESLLFKVKTLEMAMSTMPWHSSEYNFLEDKRNRFHNHLIYSQQRSACTEKYRMAWWREEHSLVIHQVLIRTTTYCAQAGAPLISISQTFRFSSTMKSNPKSWKLW